MKKILIDFRGFEHGKLFDPGARDGCLDPFIYLRERLRESGYELETADDQCVEDCAWIWFWDMPDTRPRRFRSIARSVTNLLSRGNKGIKSRPLYERCVRAGLQDKMVVFLGEPAVVTPSNWNPKLHELFATILTWNDRLVDNKKFHKFQMPLTRSFPEVPDVAFRNRKLLVNISGNKSSSHPKELYTARRDTIRYFERHYPQQFGLYGVGWDRSAEPFPSYLGTVSNKWDVFPQFRFGVCYENMRDEPGYVTEKIFDCMRAKCVPIYWGAPNICEFVNANAFIDRRRFASDAELADFLLMMDETEYRRYRQAIEDYLRSDQFSAFLPPAFADTMCRILPLQP